MSQVEIVKTFVKQEKVQPQKGEKQVTKTIGARTRELILEGHSNAVILQMILDEFQSKTTPACVAWYKTKMRKEGLIAPRGHIEVIKYFKVNEDGEKEEMSEEEVAEYKAQQEESQEV